MNTELLREIADHIERHPDEFDQKAWCGTACCVGGRAVALSGEKPPTRPESSSPLNRCRWTKSRAPALLRLSERQSRMLLGAWWPVRWYAQVGLTAPNLGGSATLPRPQDAVLILRAMADDAFPFFDWEYTKW